MSVVSLFILIVIFCAGCGNSEGDGPAVVVSAGTPKPSSGDNSSGSSLPPPADPPPTFSGVSIPVIYDDDGSPDGTTALLYLLSHPAVDLKAVNLTYGEVYPAVYIQHLGRMMDDFGIIHIALGYGEKPAYSENLHFPESLREASSKFWGFPIPNAEKTYQAHPSPELMVSIIKQSPQPVTLFVTGPCTNLAEALKIDPEIKDNIAAVYIMGGAVYVPGNVSDFYPEHENKFAEWNFVADPRAAKEVFESGLEIYLVPLDATNQVLVNNHDTSRWRGGGKIANFAADIYDWLIEIFGFGGSAIWDLMTAAIMLDHELCPFVPLHIQVVTESGPNLGQSVAVPDEEPNAYVCLEPDGDLVRENLVDIFSSGD